tara:strand:+ start:952 stop:1170 length:219 start_codon:yes stop_codon:yes gene_type:complete
MTDRTDQHGGQILNQWIEFVAPGKQVGVDQADRCVAIHGSLADRSGLKVRITHQSSPQQDALIPVDQNRCCR